MADRHLEVFLSVGGEDLHVGDLWPHRRRGVESATFSYASSYLAWPRAYELEPALPLIEGQQQTAAGQKMFGAFADSAPDRWGRNLVDRAERRSASAADRAERSLGEIDYLLGARDDMRQGSLRFREPGAPFLAPPESDVPTLVALPQLLGASERAERDEEIEADLALLLNGGSSLGGARPKAHVLDADGRAAIAKFPSPAADAWDVMRWEAVALDLAKRAGVSVPDFDLVEIAGRAVLVVTRFDRRGERRLGYASAMTMLEAGDGETGSYLEIADVIETGSASANADLAELWRRIVFSILISNTDDHLRNHGFLRTSTAGWSLSPAFDLNPNPAPGATELRTAIDFDRREASVATALEVAPDFRLDGEQARGVLAAVLAAVDEWRRVAAGYGLGAAELDRMAPAFQRQLEPARQAIAA